VFVLDFDVTHQLVFSHRLEITELTLKLFHVGIVGVKLSGVTLQVIPTREVLLAKLAGKANAQVDVLLVVLHLVFPLERLFAVLALVRSVLRVNRLRVSLQLLRVGKGHVADLAQTNLDVRSRR